MWIFSHTNTHEHKHAINTHTRKLYKGTRHQVLQTYAHLLEFNVTRILARKTDIWTDHVRPSVLHGLPL
jgi:ABC-type long-subunit fatty acid transport system fused permease/ATPase subunit